MASLFLGWFLIIVGVLFVLMGLAAAGKQTFSGLPPKTYTKGLSPNLIIEGTKALTELLKAWATQPQWFMMVVVGAYMIFAGQAVLDGRAPFPFNYL